MGRATGPATATRGAGNPIQILLSREWSMFIAALPTIAKLWKEPKCPSTDEWREKMWFIYTTEYYLAMRKKEIWPFVATWMELESVMLSEISQEEKDRYHPYVFTLMWILRNLTGTHGGGEEKKKRG